MLAQKNIIYTAVIKVFFLKHYFNTHNFQIFREHLKVTFSTKVHKMKTKTNGTLP